MEQQPNGETPGGNTVEDGAQQLSEEDNHWAFLLEDMDTVLKVSEQLSEMRETTQTWTYSSFDNVSHHDLSRKIIACVGSWPAPDWLQGSGSSKRYVNPNYIQRERLGEPATTCECSARIGKSNVYYGEGWNGEHTDDCRIEDEKFADAKVWEKRRRAMRDSLLFLKKEDYMADRLGITHSTMSYIAKKLGYERWEMRQSSRADAKKVAKILVDDYMRKEVAVTFSVDPSTISKWVNGPY